MKCNAVRLLARMILLAPVGMTAHAGVHIDVGIGLVPPPLYYGPPPVYYSPPPPVYYGPGVVYGNPAWDYGGYGWGDRRWNHDHWRGDRGWGDHRGWDDHRDGRWHGDH